MPIYEYRCANCGRKNSRFWLTISAAESAESELKCENCGRPALRRLISRVRLGKAAPDTGEQQYEFDRLTANLDDADAGEMDRFTRNLGGEPAGNDSSTED
jgi:putative FmdB family regulatory protein